MELPKSALIIGKDPSTQAVCQTLALFGVKCFSYKTSLPLTQQPPHLHECDLVIAIASHYTQVIPLVHQLRGKYKLERNFLAILPNQEQKNELEKTSLFGECDKFLYNSVPNKSDSVHQALDFRNSSLLVDLLKIIQNFPLLHSCSLTFGGWKKLESESLIGQLKLILKQDVKKALELVHQIDWQNVLLDSHQHYKKIDQFLGSYPRNHSFINNQLQIFTNQVEELLQLTIVKGD